jgi:hypothetical protein
MVPPVVSGAQPCCHERATGLFRIAYTAVETQMPTPERRPRETTNAGERRRNPRFPRSSLWSDATRLQHREERDGTIESLGLVTDRTLRNYVDGAGDPADDSASSTD